MVYLNRDQLRACVTLFLMSGDRAKSPADGIRPMHFPSPGELVAACLEKNESAWEELLKRYGNLIYSTILKVQLPEDEVEEAFQSSIVAIHQQLPRLRDPDRLVSWIIGISYRQAINRIRSRRREMTVESLPEGWLDQNSLHSVSPELPDQTRVRLTDAQMTRESFADLTERCRRLLGSLFFEDPSPDYTEISQREGIPIGSIGPTRARCLEKLRQFMLERGFGSKDDVE